MNIKKVLLLALLLILFIACGFFRDFVFLNVDEQTRIAFYHDTDSHLSPHFKFLEAYSYSTLYYLKWVLTVLFALLFMTLTLVITEFLFPKRKYIRWTLLAYAALLVFAGLFWTGGYLLQQWEKGYIIARFLMGMAEGPVPLMVLIAGFRLSDKFSAGNTRGTDKP